MDPGAKEILKGWNIEKGGNLLDVGCGAGQLVIPAAQAGIHATRIDVAANLIEHARARAQKERIGARFDEGDAEEQGESRSRRHSS